MKYVRQLTGLGLVAAAVTGSAWTGRKAGVPLRGSGHP